MSFKALFETNGKTFRVLKANYTITRPVDEMGRPTSSIVGGEITITLESAEDNMFFEHMCANEKLKEGKITFNKRNEEAKMRELSFKKAYVSSFNEIFENSGFMGSMIMTVTLIAQEIKMGNGELGNEWNI